ncbi:MAG TPA: AI-2E family transporter [Cyclobacteriaceae bacterium]|nr:AI-2E family transporter [Cyclobacteriaceae bacterium]
MNKILSPSDSKLRLLQYITLSSILLYFGRDLFIPLSFAVLISFVIYPFCAWMESKGIGRVTAILLNVLFLLILFASIVALLITQLLKFVNEWPHVQEKLSRTFQMVSQYLTSSFGISQERQNLWFSQLLDQSGSDVMGFLRGTITASAFSGVLLILTPVYSVLILYHREKWLKIVERLFPNERRESIKEMMYLTVKAYHNFIKGTALVYLIVGSLNSVGLLLLGVPHAILFGFTASVLTFIPYIGIIVGSLLPITMAWITYDSIWYPVGIVLIFAFVQYLEANVIFPLAVSSRLNVNTLVMLLAIFAGGILWGVSGMILFVPFVGIAKLIADHNPKLKTLSMILGTSERENPLENK